MGTQHKHAEVLRAIADGKDVQWQSLSTGNWCDPSINTNPIGDSHLAWRIKPEHKPDIEFFARLELDHSPKRVQVMDPNPKHHNVRLVFCGETGILKSASSL